MATANPKEGFTLSLDKPLNWTSFDVVNKIRHQLRNVLGVKKIKVGHGGTLDPLATGLVIIGVGPGTKKLDQWLNAKKGYSGVIKLGAQTVTFDREAEEINIKDVDHLNLTDICAVAKKFEGVILQAPPSYSAIKKMGVPLYKMARRGEKVEVPKRKVEIYELSILEYDAPFVKFSVACSKGTYIRSLANDLGTSLGVGGYLYDLRRDFVGDLKVEDAFIIADLISSLPKLTEQT